MDDEGGCGETGGGGEGIPTRPPLHPPAHRVRAKCVCVCCKQNISQKRGDLPLPNFFGVPWPSPFLSTDPYPRRELRDFGNREKGECGREGSVALPPVYRSSQVENSGVVVKVIPASGRPACFATVSATKWRDLGSVFACLAPPPPSSSSETFPLDIPQTGIHSRTIEM